MPKFSLNPAAAEFKPKITKPAPVQVQKTEVKAPVPEPTTETVEKKAEKVEAPVPEPVKEEPKKEEPKKEEPAPEPEKPKEEPKPEPEPEDPLVVVKRTLQEGGNKVTLELLDLYKVLPQSKVKPDFVDSTYYENRKKETQVIQFKDNNFKRGQYKDRRHHHRDGNQYNDFEKGTAKQQQAAPFDAIKRQQEDEEQKKLRQQAQKMKTKMAQPKDLAQKIRLVMNLIAPDTFDKKEAEIKELMFKSEAQTEESKGEGSLALDQENLSQIVQTLFRKAQAEKDYGRMYAQLCQNLTKLELEKLGEPKVTKKSIVKSVFRRSLLQNCRQSFDKLFMSDTDFNSMEDEAQLKLKEKLMNNIKFVAYLFKYSLVSEQIIQSIFYSLLNGPDGKVELVSDRTVEGAINLVNKIGVDIDKAIQGYTEGI